MLLYMGEHPGSMREREGESEKERQERWDRGKETEEAEREGE